MDVDSFIAKYRPEWDFLERACSRGTRGLGKLPGEEIERVVEAYQRASTHLAEARLRYGDQALHDYLNGLVGKAHAALYGARARTVRGFLRTFGANYREAARSTAPFIAVAAVILVAVSVATLLWVAWSAEARAGLLPGFAEESIRQAGGGAGGIGSLPSGHLSTFIFLNNIQVSFLAFAFGIGLGVGTIYLLAQNAVLIGTLGGAFHAAGRGGSFWSLILPHGFLELIAICIAAGAGLRMGWSIIDPGDRTRGRALVEEARMSVMVVVGVIPAFLVAAVIEGYVTGSSIPGAVQLALGGLVALAYVLVLFARPARVARPDGSAVTT
ncbi:MAG: stage II sporulation protein M, partial [Actinomycetota bacterium]